MKPIPKVMAERLANTISNIMDSGVLTTQEFYSEFKDDIVGYIRRTYTVQTKQIAGVADMRFSIVDEVVANKKTLTVMDIINVQSATYGPDDVSGDDVLKISTANLTLTFNTE